GIESAIGVGHSMGGHSIVSSALTRPETYRALFLIDPTIFPPELYGAPRLNSAFILKRRRYWESPDAMYERFSTRAPFSLWDTEVLRDYCNYGLLPAGAEFELACPPLVEASIYPLSVAKESDLTADLESIATPTIIVRGGVPWNRETFDLNASPTDPNPAARFPNAHDILLTGRSHYIPMEIPEWVAEQLLQL